MNTIGKILEDPPVFSVSSVPLGRVYPLRDYCFSRDFQVAPEDVTAAFRDVPAEESLLVNVPIQLAANDVDDDPFEELQEVVEAGTIEILDVLTALPLPLGEMAHALGPW